MVRTPGDSAAPRGSDVIDSSRYTGDSDSLSQAPRLADLTVRKTSETWMQRVEHGAGLRQTSPFDGHAGWMASPLRPDPIAILRAGDADRLPDLLPLRWSRMAASPFAFLRGAAAVMAWDLAHTPSTGLEVVIDGDAHIGNFGLFGTPLGEVVIDLNDFDEVTTGPWEWDLKRLTASVNVAARCAGMKREERREAVRATVRGYRWNLYRLKNLPVLDLWAEHNLANRLDGKTTHLDDRSADVLERATSKARATNHATMLKRVAERGDDGVWRFRSSPPILTRVDDDLREAIIDGLDGWLTTLPLERQYMMRHYHVVDIARRVVGVGSVGARAYVALLMGRGRHDPLFLQLKEATIPAHAPHRPPLPMDRAHEGRRVVFGQRLLQAAGDPLLGWTKIEGRSFYVRQMRNLKGAIDMETVAPPTFRFFAWAYGALLARAHARSGDPAVICGYCGKPGPFDRAITDWAEAYGAQTRRDHAALVEAIRSGRLQAAAEER